MMSFMTCVSPVFIRMIKSRMIIWDIGVWDVGGRREIHIVMANKLAGKRYLGKLRRRWNVSIDIN